MASLQVHAIVLNVDLVYNDVRPRILFSKVSFAVVINILIAIGNVYRIIRHRTSEINFYLMKKITRSL